MAGIYYWRAPLTPLLSFAVVICVCISTHYLCSLSLALFYIPVCYSVPFVIHTCTHTHTHTHVLLSSSSQFLIFEREWVQECWLLAWLRVSISVHWSGLASPAPFIQISIAFLSRYQCLQSDWCGGGAGEKEGVIEPGCPTCQQCVTPLRKKPWEEARRPRFHLIEMPGTSSALISFLIDQSVTG